MQNKFIKFFVVALAVAVIVPQIALAAWWNPFSWGIWNRVFHFQQTEQKQEQLLKKVNSSSSSSSISADPTAGWKTYKNSASGFELKYPEAWVIDANELGFDIHISNGEVGSFTSCNPKLISLEIAYNFKRTSQQDFRSFIEHVITEPPIGSGSFVKGSIISDKMINGHRMLETYPASKDSPCDVTRYYLEKDNSQHIVFNGYYNIDNRAQATKIIDQILSTFKFTN
jgi:hypothetical protein